MGNLPSSVAANAMDFPLLDADHYQKKRQFYRLSSGEIPAVTGAEYIPSVCSSSPSTSTTDQTVALDPATFQFLFDHYASVYDGKYHLVKTGSDSQVRGPNTVVVRNQVTKKASCEIEGVMYRSLWKGSKTGAYIQAYFQESYGVFAGLYPGAVLYYFDHELVLPPDGTPTLHRFAFCRWFRKLPTVSRVETHTKSTVEVWSKRFKNEDNNNSSVRPPIH